MLLSIVIHLCSVESPPELIFFIRVIDKLVAFLSLADASADENLVFDCLHVCEAKRKVGVARYWMLEYLLQPRDVLKEELLAVEEKVDLVKTAQSVELYSHLHTADADLVKPFT